MNARPITKENIGQMRRSALAMIAKSNYLEYRSKQMELINEIPRVSAGIPVYRYPAPHRFLHDKHRKVFELFAQLRF